MSNASVKPRTRLWLGLAVLLVLSAWGSQTIFATCGYQACGGNDFYCARVYKVMWGPDPNQGYKFDAGQGYCVCWGADPSVPEVTLLTNRRHSNLNVTDCDVGGCCWPCEAWASEWDEAYTVVPRFRCD